MQKMRVTMEQGLNAPRPLDLRDIVYGTLVLTMSESEIHCPVEGTIYKVRHLLRVGNDLVMIAHVDDPITAKVVDLRRSLTNNGEAGVLVRIDGRRFRTVGARGGDEIGCGPLILNLEEVPS